MLVNQEHPCHGAVCGACDRPLGSSYVRHVSKQERYCDYDCYRQRTAMDMLRPHSPFEAIAVLTAMASWSWMIQMGALSRALAEVYLREYDLLTTEGGDR
ncbi:collagenase-like PrtC family protease [Bradyrhizobium sp. USDA 377]